MLVSLPSPDLEQIDKVVDIMLLHRSYLAKIILGLDTLVMEPRSGKGGKASTSQRACRDG